MLSDLQKERVLAGLSYDDYSDYINSKVEILKQDESKKSKYELLRLNQVRSRRIDKTYLPDENTRELVGGINRTQTWMVLTEPMCGDSAQNLPIIQKIAAINPLINIKYLLRDRNPDIMDLYLTNGARSIPILIAYDEEWNEVFRWGSRPAAAARLVKELRSAGEEYQEKLHAWYALNKGKDIINEICELLRRELTPEVL
jgi:hypothetical protein